MARRVMPTRNWNDNIGTVFKDLKESLKVSYSLDELVYERIAQMIKDEIQLVIFDYNKGTIERPTVPGDYARRMADHEGWGRNLPLIKTKTLLNSFEKDIRTRTHKTIVSVFTDVEYAGKLEAGFGKIEAYMYMEIALERVMPKIIAYLKTEINK